MEALRRWADENRVEADRSATNQALVDQIVAAVGGRQLMARILPTAFVDPPRRAGAQGNLLGDGAAQLATDYKDIRIIWSVPSSTGSMFGNRPFTQWLHFGPPLPQTHADPVVNGYELLVVSQFEFSFL